MFTAHRKCMLNRDENRDFHALRANQINVSCECHRPGHEWSSRFGLCVDVNECIRGTHNCTLNESCLNLPGHYACVCRLGYVYNPEMKRCIHSPDIERVLRSAKVVREPKIAKTKSLFEKIIRIITRSAGSSFVCGYRINFLLIFIVSMYSVM